MFGKVVGNTSKLDRDSVSEAVLKFSTAPALGSERSEWYAIQTRYRYEKKVTTSLEQKGIAAFIPLLQEIHRWSDRKRLVEIPLFSGYAFAQVELTAMTRKTVL
jgi:hypothetical protein